MRCEHFSPSNSTETVRALAIVFIFRWEGNSAIQSHENTRYCRLFGSVSPFKVYKHSPCLFAVRFCLSLYRSYTEEKPATHTVECANERTNEHIWFLISSISVEAGCTVHIEPMLKQCLLCVEEDAGDYVYCHSNVEKASNIWATGEFTSNTVQLFIGWSCALCKIEFSVK